MSGSGQKTAAARKPRAPRRPVVAATQRELKRLGRAATGSVLGATALKLAGEIDAEGTSATAKASCARALGGIMGQLRAQGDEGVPVEELVRLAAAVEACTADVEAVLALEARIVALEQRVDAAVAESEGRDRVDELGARRAARRAK